jgi:hypothetical protein
MTGLWCQNYLMLSLKNIGFLCLGLVVGCLFHAWISAEPAKASAAMPGPLEVLNFDELLNDQEFKARADDFLREYDEDRPGSSTERVVSLVMLHQRNPEPSLGGYEISHYAMRYHGAQALLADYAIKGAPKAHRIRVERLRGILRELVTAEANYCANVFGGSGSYRDRMMEHNRVEDAVSRWALRLAKEPSQRNPDADSLFVKLRQRLAADQDILRHEFQDYALKDVYLKIAAERRPIVIVKLRALTEELKGWPPEAAEELAPLVLQTFQME